MDRFGRPNNETDHQRRAREVRQAVCPICGHQPCLPTCRLCYSKEELDELRDRIDGRSSKNTDP